MAGLNRVSLERTKADLSRVVDRLRVPYGKTLSILPRKFIFVGTSNSDNFLPADPSGNSRFVPIHCPVSYGRIEDYLQENRGFLWAEAWKRYRKGERPQLPVELRQAQSALTEEFRARDEIIENELPGIMAINERPSLRLIMTLLQLNPASTKDRTRVTNVLKHLGYHSKHTSTERYWESDTPVTAQ